MEKLIDIEHVTAAYGNKTVLRDISLTVWKDDFLGIIGPNGGGKKVDGMRLDYIWCNKKKEILSSRVVFNGLKEPVVSDHYGVLIEIKE